MKELTDPVSLNRMISAMLMMFTTTFFWGWLNLGLPMNLVLCAGIILMIFDVADFSRDPKPGPILLGSIVVPFWLVLRFFIREAR